MVNSTLILIPAHNEAALIADVIRRVFDTGFDQVVVVNDGSTDATAAVALHAGAMVISHPFNLGYGAALQTGYKYAISEGFSSLVQMDADGQHDPVWLPQLLAPVLSGQADLCIGSRFKEDSGYAMGIARSTGRLFLRSILRFFGGPNIQDPTSGLQAISRTVFDRYCDDRFPSDFPDIDVLLLVHKQGFRIAEIPVQMKASPIGRAPMHSGITSLYYPYKILLATFRNWRLK